ncbi:hypothetical protein QJQ45_011923 [Haematococcus lacustris]|nr:hypothetical protein QJQ45_011923 [Haematococcus lacustris]
MLRRFAGAYQARRFAPRARGFVTLAYLATAAGLRVGQPILILREPSNPHDPDAVSISTLSGQPLGYIPRDGTSELQNTGLSFGTVSSFGQTKSGHWGAAVYCYPHLLGLGCDPLPTNMRPAATAELLQRCAVGSPESCAALDGAQQCCEVSGTPAQRLSTSGGLVAVPVWQWDTVQQQVRLLRLAAMAAPLASAKALLAKTMAAVELDEQGQVVTMPEPILCPVKKTRRKLREHLRLRAETHSQLRVIASLFVLRIFLTCLLEEGMAQLSMERHGHAKQLVVFFGAATIGTGGGWGADAVLRACRKVVCRPRGTDQRRGRVVLVDEHRTSRVSSAVNGKQPCEEELDKLSATRPAGWKPPAGQVEPRLVRPAWSQQRDQPVRGMMWCPVVAPRKPPQAPRSSQAATQPAASEPGPSTPPPAKRSKPAAEPTKGKGKGKAAKAKAKPAPQPGRWLDRDCNAALNMQRIGESRWRPLELCYWPEQGALPAKGKEYPGLGYKRVRDKPPKAQEQQQQPAMAQ